MLLIGAAGYAFAGSIAPEIDASSGVAALTLLSGGLAVLWGRSTLHPDPRHHAILSFQCTIGSPAMGDRKYGIRLPFSDPI